jgi:putative ABC transport system ATP-binding protein
MVSPILKKNIKDRVIMWPLVEMKNIKKDYYLGETRIPALKDITLSIHKGEFVAVWGPSGSGKSTLCNLMGLTDDHTSGTLLFQNTDVTSLSDNQKSEMRNRHLGFIFQSFNLIPVLSALDNVTLPLLIKGEVGKNSMNMARQLLSELGIGDYILHRPHKLSGGQQQRVAIARALITDPDLIIADEPTANLDSENALKIIDLMREINRTKGTTFVFSTHDQRLLDRVNRQIHLQDGLILNDSENNIAGEKNIGTDRETDSFVKKTQIN